MASPYTYRVIELASYQKVFIFIISNPITYQLIISFDLSRFRYDQKDEGNTMLIVYRNGTVFMSKRYLHNYTKLKFKNETKSKLKL